MTLLLILSTCAFVPLCGAGKINCTVSQSTEGTNYSIPKPVLATGTGDKDEVVMNESISNLVTWKCIPKVLYERTCSSENLEEFRSVCEIDCHEIEKMIKDPDHSWTVAGVFVMVLVACVLIYKFRNRLKRTFRYTSVNKRKDNLI